MEADGYGAVLKVAAPTVEDQHLLAAMKTLSTQPLASYSAQWKTLPQSLVPIAETEKAATAPPGMVRIPEGDFTFRVNGIEIEGDDDEGVDVQYPGEVSARRYHSIPMHMKSYWMDKYEVTNADFKKFIDATHYAPADSHNFLRDWKSGDYPGRMGKQASDLGLTRRC